ncbi:MAG: ABC transporter permease [Candidatus Latescibacteria bacterium]|nr:ABC transporter permease [Candidatus Latescibacterota bacterium]
MRPLFRWITCRHLFQERGRTLLTVLGVALGVAVFVSIRLANHSALASFADTVDAVAGKANLQVVSDSEGFDERIYPKVRAVPGVQAAAPVVQTYALAAPGKPDGKSLYTSGDRGPYNETLLVLGVDLFSEAPFARYESPRRGDRSALLDFLADPRGVAVTRTLANRHHLKQGEALTLLSAGQPVVLTIRQIIESQEFQQAMGGNVVIMDIATAQEVFHRYGTLDRIDLLVDPGQKEAVQAALQPLLPPHAEVGQPQGRTQQVENMVSAFRLSLTALSFIALFVSTFLIFNAVSMAVLRRRREIGILRSIGVTRRQVMGQFMSEALFLGVVGSAVGLAAGTVLAKATLGSISRTLTDLYLVVHARNLYLDPVIFLQGFALGVGMSLLSALAPAFEAARTVPNVTVRQGILIEAMPLSIGRWTAAGVGTLVMASAVALWTVSQRRPFGGFVSAFLLLVGFSLVAPGFTLLMEHLTGPLMRLVAGIEGVLGARYLRDAVARTSVVVAALMVAVGMMVGLSIMVSSFRQTVDLWINQTIRGDLYVEPVGRRVTGSATVLPPDLVEIARHIPGVAAVNTYRSVRITYEGKIAYVAAVDFDIQQQYGRLQFIRGNSAEVIARARSGNGVVVTESFSYRHRVDAGDTVRVLTPTGTAVLSVAGVFYDYSTDAGAILMDRQVFARLWNDPRTESLAMYVKPGASVDQVRTRFIEAAGRRIVLHIMPNRGLRERVLAVFDQTFQITYALQAIAIVVAVLGVISTLTALILQRGREIGVLRAVGALRRQVHTMVLVESGLLGLIGALMGCVCGVALSILLIYVINKQFFGWSIRMTVDPVVFVQAVGLMVVTAVLAGLWPARLAATRVAADAMRAE